MYLAGPITGLTFVEAAAWRDRATFLLGVEDVDTLDPLRGKEHLAGTGPLPNDFDGGLEAVAQDLDDVHRSDVVLANFEGCRSISAGTMAELGYAKATQAQVVSVVPRGNPHDHIFVKYISSRVVETLDDGIQAVLEVLGRA